MRRLLILLVIALQSLLLHGWQHSFEPLHKLKLAESPIKISQLAVARRPFTVVADRGAILGQQDGTFELWALPYKMIQHAHLSAELDGYGVPIDLNPLAATIDVQPDRTTITYSHSAIVVRQEMFVVRGGTDSDPAAVVLFSIDSTRSGVLSFDFEPVIAPMWPAPQHGAANASWMPIGSGGGFLLTTDDPKVFGILAVPGATSGILAPYQERPQKRPLQFRVKFDAEQARTQQIPLIAIMSNGKTPLSDSAKEQLALRVVEAVNRIPALYEQTVQHYTDKLDKILKAETPDRNFDLSLQWSELAIDKSEVRFHDETGLTAGWYPSADSLRPGFGWFFGRDALWTLYAVHSYGDFGLAKRELEFLIHRQRDDGKVMHEFSQTADLVDWKSFPYWYASADATPLLVITMEDYVRASGDIEFLKKNWDSIRLAYRFTRLHDADGDGIYDNSEGTGWVESWPPGMPNQEVYLAALDQESAEAYSRLASLIDDRDAEPAKATADLIRRKLNDYQTTDGFYCFSRNRDGTYDTTATIFPSVAWWNGRLRLENPGAMLGRWASSEFLTDWGSREVSSKSKLYDPISYHQGSVWPLFTGWASMAEYRSGKPLAGYQHFMANERLPFLSDLGAATELLSGDLYEPLGRSSSHQMWSSAMIVTPAVRGLFGIESDVIHHRLRLNPHLPASWDYAKLRNVPFGSTTMSVNMIRHGANLEISIESIIPIQLCVDQQNEFKDTNCGEAPSKIHAARIVLPSVEVGVPDENPQPGERTSGLKVISENYGARELSLKLQAPAGSTKLLDLRMNGIPQTSVHIDGGVLQGKSVRIDFAGGSGFVERTLNIRW